MDRKTTKQQQQQHARQRQREVCKLMHDALVMQHELAAIAARLNTVACTLLDKCSSVNASDGAPADVGALRDRVNALSGFEYNMRREMAAVARAVDHVAEQVAEGTRTLLRVRCNVAGTIAYHDTDEDGTETWLLFEDGTYRGALWRKPVGVYVYEGINRRVERS